MGLREGMSGGVGPMRPLEPIQEIWSCEGHLFGEPPISQQPPSIHHIATVKSPAMVLYKCLQKRPQMH